MTRRRRWLAALALMSALPLTLIGVVEALLAFGSTLNMFSVIGIVMLMGLVTKNAILLVDFAIRARERGLEHHAALLEAARVRLRPILMTTLAMIFGMVPVVYCWLDDLAAWARRRWHRGAQPAVKVGA